jgi:ferredoxin
VSDPGLGQRGYLGEFQVTAVGEGRLELRPAETLGQEQTDLLATSFGPWSLSETRPGTWPSHYVDSFMDKEWLAAEAFLVLDPLVSLSTAIAARSWVWSLAAAGGILLVSLLIPRGFCGYVCPLGTVIDLFDWSLARRIKWFRVSGSGWWATLKYYLLVAVLASALCGILLSGFVAAIPVLTRAAAFVLTPIQTGWARDWHQIPPWNIGHFVSLGLFALVLGLGFMQPRFWCKYVCPTGAVFSVGNIFRTTQRNVLATCIDCGKCVEVCPFDAIEPDFTTRVSDCTFCQTCGGVCPVQSIQFVPRWNRDQWKQVDEPTVDDPTIGRRGFLARAAGGLGAAFGGASLALATRLLAADQDLGSDDAVVRPPGSVPEKEFLQLCIRCGACYQACPNNVLQPMGLERGPDHLWTPRVVADWSGCEPSCSNCGQVCPTSAIRALPLAEKRVARMGLAVVNESTCLPFAGRDACQLCVDECRMAGYDAIEFVRVGTELDETGTPIEETGFLAPVVRADRCVGCGLCQTRCYRINVSSKQLLDSSAIVVVAGAEKEDRIHDGSYAELRAAEQREREAAQRKLMEQRGTDGDYLPDFLQ